MYIDKKIKKNWAKIRYNLVLSSAGCKGYTQL